MFFENTVSKCSSKTLWVKVIFLTVELQNFKTFPGFFIFLNYLPKLSPPQIAYLWLWAMKKKKFEKGCLKITHDPSFHSFINPLVLRVQKKIRQWALADFCWLHL